MFKLIVSYRSAKVWTTFCLLKSLKWSWNIYSQLIINLILLAAFIVKSTDNIARLFYKRANIAIITSTSSWKYCISDDAVCFCILAGLCMYAEFFLDSCYSHVSLSAHVNQYFISLLDVPIGINMDLAECPLLLPSGKKGETKYMIYFQKLVKTYEEI